MTYKEKSTGDESGMTEKEAISLHIEESKHRIDTIQNYIKDNKDANVECCERNVFILENIIKVLEEIEQYRALGGTPELVAKVINFLGNDEDNSIINDLELLNQYKFLGTVEELKEAREKQIAKKVDEDYCCPVCHTCGLDDNGVAGLYCPNCGQKLDWGNEDAE